jgi:nucleoside-diphosphate-sugar epimerase
MKVGVDGDDWITEDIPLDSSPGRASICGPVIAMETMVREIPPEKLECCILRGGRFVGKGTFQDRAIENLRAGQERVPCDGSSFLSHIHVEDMASSVAAALVKAPAGSTFNIVDEPIRQGEYLERLAALVGAPKPRRDPNLACPPSQRCSNQAAKAVLGWKQDVRFGYSPLSGTKATVVSPGLIERALSYAANWRLSVWSAFGWQARKTGGSQAPHRSG